MDPDFMRKARGWSAEEWQDAVDRLTARGLLDASAASLTLTDEGRVLREWVEERTDESALAPWQVLGEERTDRLAELLTPIALALIEGNEGMRISPIALTTESVLAS
jgi:hypothetical protein